MFSTKSHSFAVLMVAGAIIGTSFDQPRAQQQEICGATRDDIVAYTAERLGTGIDLLAASVQQLTAIAAEIVRSAPECSLDVVVAMGTVRPDAANAIGSTTASIVPERGGELVAAAQGLAAPPPEPAVGQLPPAPVEDSSGPYDGPFEDRIDRDDADGSPA